MIELSLLSEKRILVAGDVMLDRYLWGDVSRISPEAPVPVVRVRQNSEVPGGAGNVASNLAGLGCPVSLIGICGKDESAERLKKILLEKNIDSLVFESNKRPTITKTRVMARGQQLLRLDEEEPRTLSHDLSEKMITVFEKNAVLSDVVILSDYGKGIFQTPGLCQHLIRFCNSQDIPVLVDPKGSDWTRYRGATCITPNTAELELVAGHFRGEDDSRLFKASSEIHKKFGLKWLIVTRGSKGMNLFGPENFSSTLPARAREVFDVSGAGDTVIATLAAGLAMKLSFPESAHLSNLAAGIVVGKLGTQPVTAQDLSSALQLGGLNSEGAGSSKIAGVESARIMVKSWQSSGQKVAFTNGCYDLLHPGHIHILQKSKEMGDRLVVGLNTDASVKRLKGSKRPVLSERDRAAILSAIGYVDLVVLFDEDTPLELIQSLKPDILVKGEDYRIDQVVGREFVESYGGKVCLAPLLKGYSTTKIVDKLKNK